MKTQILLLKTKESKGLGLGLFYSELAPTDPCCSMRQTLLRRKKYGEEMPDEQPQTHTSLSYYVYGFTSVIVSLNCIFTVTFSSFIFTPYLMSLQK